jgi:hypothetical protein
MIRNPPSSYFRRWVQSRVFFAIIPEISGRSGNASAGFSSAEQA